MKPSIITSDHVQVSRAILQQLCRYIRQVSLTSSHPVYSPLMTLAWRSSSSTAGSYSSTAVTTNRTSAALRQLALRPPSSISLRVRRTLLHRGGRSSRRRGGETLVHRSHCRGPEPVHLEGKIGISVPVALPGR